MLYLMFLFNKRIPQKYARSMILEELPETFGNVDILFCSIFVPRFEQKARSRCFAYLVRISEHMPLITFYS